MDDRTPCPFCGWKSVRIESDRGRMRTEYTVIGEWFAYCPNCGARGPVVYQHHRSDETCMYEAMELWNHRTRRKEQA